VTRTPARADACGFVLYLPPRTKFGVMIYGYGQYTSDWYPGGLDLKSIPQ